MWMSREESDSEPALDDPSSHNIEKLENAWFLTHWTNMNGQLAAVSLLPSLTHFSLYISQSCVVKTGEFALQHVSTTKLKYLVGFGRQSSIFF